MDTRIKNIYDAILEGNAQGAKAGVQTAIDGRLNPAIILDGMVGAMKEVGRQFEIGEYYVPEMLIAARAMQSGMALLKPYLKEANVKPAGRVAVGTVKGDLHDIGKNLVGMMMEGAGFEVIDLGADVPPEKFVEAIENHQVDIIGLSALLTTTMQGMKTTVEALKAAGVRDRVKVIIGGAPVNEDYSLEIGADGYAADASRAATLALSLLLHG